MRTTNKNGLQISWIHISSGCRTRTCICGWMRICWIACLGLRNPSHSCMLRQHDEWMKAHESLKRARRWQKEIILFHKRKHDSHSDCDTILERTAHTPDYDGTSNPNAANLHFKLYAKWIRIMNLRLSPQTIRIIAHKPDAALLPWAKAAIVGRGRVLVVPLRSVHLRTSGRPPTHVHQQTYFDDCQIRTRILPFSFYYPADAAAAVIHNHVLVARQKWHEKKKTNRNGCSTNH